MIQLMKMSEVNPSFIPERHGNIPYPAAFRSNTVDKYHDVAVADPYQWMEVPSAARMLWLADQCKLNAHFGPDESATQRIVAKFKGYLPESMEGTSVTRGNKEFFYRVTGGQGHYVFVCRELGGKETAVINPNVWSEDGSVGLSVASISDSGEYVAYARNPNDADIQHWQILDTATGETLPDSLPDTIDSYPSWVADADGFFYEATDQSGRRSVLYHKIGTQKEVDVLFFEPAAGDTAYYLGKVSTDKKRLYITAEHADGSQSLDVMNVDDPENDRRQLIPPELGMKLLKPIYTEGQQHVLWINKDSPNGRIVALQEGKSTVKDLIPESTDVIIDAAMSGDYLGISYYDGVKSFVILHDKSGKPMHTILPDEPVGAVSFASYGIDDLQPTLEKESPSLPATIHRFDVKNFKSTIIQEPEYKYEYSNYRSELIHACSQDGARIPLFVTAHRDVRPDGGNHTLVEGYGGFGNGARPKFNPYAIPWLESGGIYVQPCLRGGDEFGSAWHEAGKKSGKDRVVDDFIAAGEEMVRAGYTSPDLLVAKGASCGGFVVAAAILKRPELYRAALMSGSLLDMLRFDKGEQEQVGRYWRDEFGNTAVKDQFDFLLGISPVHNVRPAAYPAVFAAVGEDDDRVLPANSYKFIAGLQMNQTGDSPILLEVESSTGHGVTSVERIYRKVSREYAFIERVLGIHISS